MATIKFYVVVIALALFIGLLAIFSDSASITGDFAIKCSQSAQCPVGFYCSQTYGDCRTTRPVDLRPATFKVENSDGCWLATLSVHNDNKGKSQNFNVVVKTAGWEKSFTMDGLDRLRTGFVKTCIDYTLLSKGKHNFQVVVDPDGKVPDIKRSNNIKTWTVELK